MELLEIVRATVEKHKMFSPPEKVLVACSGGPDSTALLYLLREMGLELAVAHFNHHLRGAESDRDAGFVRDLAASLGFEFFSGEADVAETSRRERGNLEDCARRLRRSFLRSSATQCGAGKIALGHTTDDLIETFFMKLMRGSGRTGLTAIAPVHGIFVRPLIDIRKALLIDYLHEHGLSFVIDSSNTDTRFLRNHLRAGLIPQLEAISSGSLERIKSTIAILQWEESYLKGLAQDAFDRCCQHKSRQATGIVRQKLAELPLPLISRVLRLAAAQLKSHLEFKVTERLIHWSLDPGAPAAFSGALPRGVHAFRQGGVIWLAHKTRHAPEFLAELPIPGGIDTPSGILESRLLYPADFPPKPDIDDSRACYMDFDKTGSHFVVRNRRLDETYTPCGESLPRQVKKMLSNRKIPACLASILPVISNDSRICWIPGLPVADEFKVTRSTRQVLEIRFKFL